MAYTLIDCSRQDGSELSRAARTPEDVMNLAKLFENSKHTRAYPAGTTIFAQGEPRDVMYVVVAGEVDLQRGGQTFETVSAGTLVGEMAMIDKAPRSATAVAKTDCTLMPIDDRRFEFMVSETPSFALHVMRILVDRLRRTTERAIGS